jgi:hypothetical protein
MSPPRRAGSVSQSNPKMVAALENSLFPAIYLPHRSRLRRGRILAAKPAPGLD